MANITLTVRDAVRSSNGNNITDNAAAVTAADVFFFDNNGSVVIHVANAAGSNTVTAVTQGTIDSLAVTDLTATIAASKTHILGPFPPSVYNNSAGQVQITFSATATAYALRVS